MQTKLQQGAIAQRFFDTIDQHDIHSACDSLRNTVLRAQNEPSHHAPNAQRLISEVESLRRFVLSRATLRAALMLPCGLQAPSLGAALVDCMFQWVAPLNVATIQANLRAPKLPDANTRRLHASIMFLLNLELGFLNLEQD